MSRLNERSALLALVLGSALATGVLAAVTADLDAVYLAVAFGLTIMVSLLASRGVALIVAAVLGAGFSFTHAFVALGPLAVAVRPYDALSDPFVQRGDLWLVAMAGAVLLVATAVLTGLIKPVLIARRDEPGDPTRIMGRGPGLRRVALEAERAGRYQRGATLAVIQVAAPTDWAEGWSGTVERAPTPAELVGELLRPHLRPSDLVVAYADLDLLVLLPETGARESGAALGRLHKLANRQLGCALLTRALELPLEVDRVTELVPELSATADKIRRAHQRAELRAGMRGGGRAPVRSRRRRATPSTT